MHQKEKRKACPCRKQMSNDFKRPQDRPPLQRVDPLNNGSSVDENDVPGRRVSYAIGDVS